MSRIRERRWGTIAPPEEGDLDGFLLLAQAGILVRIGKAIDLQGGLAAITGASLGAAGPRAHQRRRVRGGEAVTSDDVG
jgi:hypothetical protein